MPQTIGARTRPLPLIRAGLGLPHLATVPGFVLALTVPEWVRSRETSTFSATRLAVRMLDPRALLGPLPFAPVNPLSGFGAGARFPAIARGHPATARLALEDRAFLAKPFVITALALVGRAIVVPAAARVSPFTHGTSA